MSVAKGGESETHDFFLEDFWGERRGTTTSNPRRPFLIISQDRGVYIDERRHRVLCDKVMSESRRTRTRHISSNLCLFERAEGGRSMGWFSERLLNFWIADDQKQTHRACCGIFGTG
jgi:3-phenylpropionate/cinnamic acid dioxygenase small subunit